MIIRYLRVWPLAKSFQNVSNRFRTPQEHAIRDRCRSGFKRYESKANQFEAAQNVRRSFVLEVGAVTEINVEAAATLVNTVSPEQQSFSRQEVTELPLARRNFSNVLTIGTGTTTSASGGVRVLEMIPRQSRVTSEFDSQVHSHRPRTRGIAGRT